MKHVAKRKMVRSPSSRQFAALGAQDGPIGPDGNLSVFKSLQVSRSSAGRVVEPSFSSDLRKAGGSGGDDVESAIFHRGFLRNQSPFQRRDKPSQAEGHGYSR